MKFIAAADRLYLLDAKGSLWLLVPFHSDHWEKIRLPDGVVVVDAAVTAQVDYDGRESTDYFVYIRAADGRMFQTDRYGQWSKLPGPS